MNRPNRRVAVVLACLMLWQVLFALAAYPRGLAPAKASPLQAGLRANRLIEPLDVVPLARLGYADATLRGRAVSAEFFVPGPGEFPVAGEHWLDLDYQPSSLLAPGSVMTVWWNGLPLADRSLAGLPGGRARESISVPAERISREVNRLQVQATLRLTTGECPDDDQGMHLTVFSTTQVRYSYAGRAPFARPVAPDLGQFPAPFFVPNSGQAPPVRLVLPAAPSSAETTAALRIAARLGNAAAARGIDLSVLHEGRWRAADLDSAHLIFVGAAGTLPSLDALAAAAGVQRSAGGAFLDPAGVAAMADTGVLFAVQSPWNPARLALVVR